MRTDAPGDLTSLRKQMNALRPPGHTRIHMTCDGKKLASKFVAEVAAGDVPRLIDSAQGDARNRPSTTVLAPKLTPSVLGQLIALYEHQTFVEGVLCGINSFDRWGIELGKTQAVELQAALSESRGTMQPVDGSTAAVVGWYRSIRGRSSP